MSQTTEAQTTPPTSEEVIGKVNESIAALQEAQKTVVEGAQLLAAHVNDPTAHGAAIPEVVEQQLPTPVMEGTSLKWEKKDGTIVAGPVDLKGAPGQDGADGDTGPRPEHRWEGTKLLVQNSDGSWPAEGVDLKGDKGDTGQVEGLSDAVDSNSSTTPASSKAVKTAYDKAVTAQNAANTADSKAQAAQSAADTAQAAAEAADAKAQAAQSAADAAQSAADAAQSAADAAQAGVDGIPLASASVAGLVKIGTNLSVSDGTVSVPSATPSKRGVVFSSTTAAANTVPQAGEDGTLDESWVPKADYWDMFPPLVPIHIWGAGLGGSDGRRAIMPGESEAREEWILCDGGSDGKGETVPDLRGRYIRGASESEPEGTEGGSEDVAVKLSGSTGATTLNTSQMPSHTHTVTAVSTGGRNDIIGTEGAYTDKSRTTSSAGGNSSHTHPLSGSVSGTHTDPHLAMNYFIKVV